jgi:hypothetical protein
LEVLQITDAEALSWWAWQGYRQENPNWDRPTLEPPPPGTDPYTRDGKWCVRNPTHGLNYLRKEPFYLVLKGGWPYVGILLKQGQVKNLDNHKVEMGIAEEIYPVMLPMIDKVKASGESLGYEATIFENMRFLNGEVQPGENFKDEVNLEGSSLSVLPPNLVFQDSVNLDRTKITEIPTGTVAKRGFSARGSAVAKIGEDVSIEGELDLSNTPLTALPAGLKVSTLNVANTALTELPENLVISVLNIEGTQIKKLPETLVIERTMTWSEPLTLDECKMQFFRNTLPRLKSEAAAHPKMKGLSPASTKKAWKQAERDLIKFYMTDKSIEGHVKSMFIYKKPGNMQEAVKPSMTAVAAAMRHHKSGTVGVGSNHSEAMEDLVNKMKPIWHITFDELETMDDPQRNHYYRGVDIGFVTAARKFITRDQSIEAGGVTHGEEIE